MIAVHFLDGLACPFFCCDVCRKRITESRGAMAAWGELIEDPRRSIVPAYVHKGVCLDIFERNLSPGEMLQTDELRDHYQHLGTNSLAIGEALRL